jgi:hypothetical protein
MLSKSLANKCGTILLCLVRCTICRLQELFVEDDVNAAAHFISVSGKVAPATSLPASGPPFREAAASSSS